MAFTGDRTKVVLLSAAGGEPRNMVSQSDALGIDPAFYAYPRFSPKGDVLAVRTVDARVEHIDLIPLSGGNPSRLITWDSRVLGMDWTADGEALIVSSEGYLWRVPVSGGGPERLALAAEDPAMPSVARRGSLLAYAQGRLNANIWTFRARSSSAKKFEAEPLIASTLTDMSPQFSADGKRIVFASGRSGAMEIWVSDALGQNLFQLTFGGKAEKGSPRWSPDGQFVAFDWNLGGPTDI